jgi:hypothetical protein
MLVRPERDDAVLCIGQASHAWVSGQIARAWADVGGRREELCLAAEQHDVAWMPWDAAPELDPSTGVPYSFLEMPFDRWEALWAPAPERLAAQSAYAALLVSLHGTRLQEHRPGAEGYLAGQARVQERLIALTGADAAELARHRDLIALWDRLSLALCLRWDPYEQDGLRLRRAGEHHTLDPWPLAVDELELTCEGRELRGRYDGVRAMRDALAAAPPRPLRFTLRPAG